MSLLDCPQDILHLIFAKLSGKHIISLWMCCNHQLNDSLVKLVLQFDWKHYPGFSFNPPFILKHLRKLQHLSFSVSKRTPDLDVSPFDLSFFASERLQTLELRFRSAFETFLSTSEAPILPSRYYTLKNISLLFPCLKELTIVGRTTYSASIFDVLPSKLEKLKLFSTTFQSMLPINFPIRIGANTLLKSFKTNINWPESQPFVFEAPWLESLTMFSYDPFSLLPGLPPSLTNLKLNTRNHLAPDFKMQSVLFEHLPLLKSFKLNCVDQDFLIESLPKSLSKLHINLFMDYMKPDRISRLVDILPPHLTELQFGKIIFSVSNLKCLPSSLTSFANSTLYNMNDEKIPLFPRQLHTLNIESKSSSFELDSIRFLPRSITNLSLPQLDDQSVLLLPPLLKSLSFRNGMLSEIGCAKLPQSLTRLKTNPNSFSSQKCLSSLPNNLKKLYFGWNRGYPSMKIARDQSKDDQSTSNQSTTNQSTLNQSTSMTTISTSSSFQPIDYVIDHESYSYIPKFLKELYMIVEMEATDEWIFHLASLNHLKLLWIRCPLTSSKLSSKHLLTLPDSLTSLSTTISGFIHEDHLFKLPKRLRILHIIGNSEVGLTNRGVGLLPRSLYSIIIPPAPFLTAWCVSDLPPTLRQLELGGKTPSWMPQN